jgi:hypothetical protein
VNRSNEERLPRPEEFPIGSAESRAAARVLLDSREKGVRRIQLLIRGYDNDPGSVGSWWTGFDGNLCRTVCIPTGTDEETERRLLATP